MAAVEEFCAGFSGFCREHEVFDFREEIPCTHFVCHVGEVEQVYPLLGVPAFRALDVRRGFVSPCFDNVVESGAAVISWYGIEDLLPFGTPVLKGIQQ